MFWTIFSKAIQDKQFWALIGVVLGFLLGEGSRYVRYRGRIYKLKRIIEEELKSILSQIPHKKDIVNQILESLNNMKILPGLSVRTMNTGYKQHIGEIYEHLGIRQRNCLHVIYERLDIADNVLFSFEHDIVTAIREKTIVNPFLVYKNLFEEILSSYNTVESLIKGYLAGRPEDVFYVETKS